MPSLVRIKNLIPSLPKMVRLAVLGVLGLSGKGLVASDIPEEVLFNRDIRPVMSNTCFKCHGADVKANEADLRLDLPEEAFRERVSGNGGRWTPIVPGDPDASEIWRRITSKDPDEVMPPPDNLHQLTGRDKAVIRRWIEQGAAYQDHWAYISPVKSDAPPVKNTAAVRNGIDRFILARLEREGVDPSPAADRNTLIRRLSLDLLGLPPTPREVKEFVEDTRPDAYERLVDRLLASPHYGERMAVPWLDVVRFADTVGFHGDQGLNIFPYREYVIDAFNRNKPYDQFVTEQIAGDLLPDPTDEQRVATGFNRLNMVTREGGAQPKEYLAKYAADRVRAVGTAFLGATLACAECHDHKYDPFSTKDFYSMAAFFADVKQYGVYNDYKYTPEPELKGWNNDFPFPPEIEVRSDYLVKRKQRLEAAMDQAVSRAADEVLRDPLKRPGLESWVATVADRLEKAPDGWVELEPGILRINTDTRTEILPDRSVRFRDGSGDKPEKAEQATLVFRGQAGPVATLRLEVLPDEAHGGHIYRRDQLRLDMSVRWELRRANQDTGKPLLLDGSYANLVGENYFNGWIKTVMDQDVATYDSYNEKEREPTYFTSFVSSRHHAKDPYAISYFLKEPIELMEGDELVLRIECDHLARVRASLSPLGMMGPDTRLDGGLLAAFRENDAGKVPETLAAQFVKSNAWYGSSYPRLLTLYRKIAECRDGYAFSAVTRSAEPLVTRVLPRGDWKNDSGEVVSPGPPEFIRGEVPEPETGRLSRLDLARWITHPDNPLTARTMVNRLWAQFFGTGLSAVLDDLGNQGEWPSHPGLLDWLAVEFVESGWDIKAMVKRMVTSATYRRQSTRRPELTDIDPNNRLLARQNPRRLEAEFIRDNALFIAGLMDKSVGGPSARPYQPPGYYEPLNFPKRQYQADADERQYRRGVYTHWQRTFLHPMMANFDAPAREECLAQRTVSNTPQQALTLLNDPTFVEAARVFAQSILEAPAPGPGFNGRLTRMFQRALSREPSQRELDSLSRFLADRLEYFENEPGEATAFLETGLSPVSEGLNPVELAAWSAVARVILNLNETLVRY